MAGVASRVQIERKTVEGELLLFRRLFLCHDLVLEMGRNLFVMGKLHREVSSAARHGPQIDQPDFLPDALESGTQNNVGIAGLGAGVDFILETGVETIMKHERELTALLIQGLREITGVTIYGPLDVTKQTSTVSITFDSLLPGGEDQSLGGCGSINLAWMEEGPLPSEAGGILNKNFDILVRAGLHCAPLAHKALGTFPEGTIRLSMGYFNTQEEVETVVKAVQRIVEGNI